MRYLLTSGAPVLTILCLTALIAGLCVSAAEQNVPVQGSASKATTADAQEKHLVDLLKKALDDNDIPNIVDTDKRGATKIDNVNEVEKADDGEKQNPPIDLNADNKVTADDGDVTEDKRDDIGKRGILYRIIYRNCADLYKHGYRKSAVYEIKPFISGAQANKAVSVYCDMETDGGGWTVIQHRFGGNVDFYRNWVAYKNGFGSVWGEHWLGNDIISALTTNRVPSELRVDLHNWAGNTAYAKYRFFMVEGAKAKYKLHVTKYSGTAGDSFTYHNGQAFSTYDVDNDPHSSNCAKAYHGAWWYKTCHYVNLNGRYYYSGDTKKSSGITWYHWTKGYKSLMYSEMKIRPNSFKA